MKNKLWFSEQCISELQNDYPNIDSKLDHREVILRIDAVVNELAARNFFDNWKFSGPGVDDQFVTTFPVTVQDRTDGKPSFFIFPANYIALPRNEGIVEVYPLKWNDENQSAVAVMSPEDYRKLLSNAAGNMQGRLSGYPKWPNFEFTTCEVAKKYGSSFECRLAIRDSSQIADDAPYGIPADKENLVISTVVAWYRARRAEPTDSTRDNKDVA